MVTTRRRHHKHRGPSNSRRNFARRLYWENLEDRRLLAIDISDPLVNIPGINSIAGPPDTVMDVGSNHVIQMENTTAFQIWDKHGNSLAGPTTFGTLWATNTLVHPDPGNECRNDNLGDPIVVYDHLADRWLMSEFHSDQNAAGNQIAPFGICVAISRTADPVGGVDGNPATPGDAWFLYRFDTPNFG
jgi:hypothetical protein